MKYYEVDFTIQCVPELMQDARDLLCATAGEAGFESFEETDGGVRGYVQRDVFSRQLLDSLMADFPLPDTPIIYDVREAEDKNWNEAWEQEGFEPIVVDGGRIVVHDGRHLPHDTATPGQCLIEIDTRQAFGTGTHETTRMVLAALLRLPLSDGRMLDCGCGTGILSIAALKLGAREAVGYDIDEWSVDNARHNAVINRVDDRFRSLLGNVDVLQGLEGRFDVVAANINRNILLADMPALTGKMAPGAWFVVSGFYTADAPLLVQKATSLGLTHQASVSENDWACLTFQLL